MSVKDQLVQLLPQLLADGKDVNVNEVMAKLKQTTLAAASKSDVNSVLYTLAAKGMLQRIVTPGSMAPKFKILSTTSSGVADNKSDDVGAKILAFLADKKDYVSTSDITSSVNFGTKAVINKALYDLMSKGKVLKQSDAGGKNPRWILSSTSSFLPPTLNPSIASTPMISNITGMMSLLSLDPKVQEFNMIKSALQTAEANVPTTGFIVYKSSANEKEENLPVPVTIYRVGPEKSIFVRFGGEAKYGSSTIPIGAEYELSLDSNGIEKPNAVMGKPRYNFNWIKSLSDTSALVVPVPELPSK
jgi:predicted transcriptional regulator